MQRLSNKGEIYLFVASCMSKQLDSKISPAGKTNSDVAKAITKIKQRKCYKVLQKVEKNKKGEGGISITSSAAEQERDATVGSESNQSVSVNFATGITQRLCTHLQRHD